MYDPVGRQHNGPLVGREAELRELDTLIARIEQTTDQASPTKRLAGLVQRPCGVFLLGEAGIGKTRLAEETVHRVLLRDWAVAWHRAYEQERVSPYWLWCTVLRTCLQLALWRPKEEDTPARFLPLIKLLPELVESWPAAVGWQAVSSVQEHFLLWEAVLAVFKSISRRGSPMLLVLDDMQWADEDSCKLLGYLLRHLSDECILIVCTCRLEEMAGRPLEPLMSYWQHECLVTTLHVCALSNEQIYRLLSAFSTRFSPATIRHIQDQAAGNPFFAEELARSASIDADARLPQSIVSAFSLRLERLSPACQRFLSEVVVLGSSFDINLIRALEESLSTTRTRRDGLIAPDGLYDKTNGGYGQLLSKEGDASPRVSSEKQSPDTASKRMFGLLEEALQAGILTETGTDSHITFSFWHPLMATYLYENLSAARRARLHRHVASILQQLYAGRLPEHAAIIAYHLLHADASIQDIVYYAEIAGNYAYALSSYPQAEKFYRIVLNYLPANPLAEADLSSQQPDFASGSPDDSKIYKKFLQKIEILELLAECASIQGKYEEARELYEQALYLRQHRPVSKKSKEYLREAQIQAMLWCEIGRTWHDAGQMDHARECYDRSEAILRCAGIVAGTAWAYIRHRQSYASWREANYNEARILAHEALSLFEANNLPGNGMSNQTRSTMMQRILAGDPMILARVHGLLGMIANGEGRATEALQQYTRALELHEQYGGKRDVAVVCCNLGDLQLRRADYASAQAFFKRSLRVAEQVGESPLVAFNFGNLGQVEMQRGNLIEAENELRRGIVLAEHVHDSLHISMWYAYLSSVLLDQGRIAEASHVLYRAWRLGRAKHISPYVGQAQVVLGRVRIAQARMVACSKDKTHSAQEMLSFLLRAKKVLLHTVSMDGLEAETRTEGRVALAQAMLLLGDIEQARSVIIQALAEAQQCELKWLVPCAQRVLGGIYAAQALSEQAMRYFEQALEVFRKTGMHLEYARTLQQSGELLMQQEADVEQKTSRQALKYLREARKMFKKCGANLDMEIISKKINK
jgi:tetratricopeptide (TPR) repeat protein